MKLAALSCFCVDVFPEIEAQYVGGNALNVGYSAMQNEGAEVYLIGAIGKDQLGESIKAYADKRGLDHTYLHQLSGQTASNKIYLSKEGERYFKPDSWQGGVYQEYRLTKEDTTMLHQMDVVVTTIHDSVLDQVIEERKKGNFLLAVDFHDDAYDKAWEELIPWIDIFFMSGNEEMLRRYEEWSKKYEGVFVAGMGAAGSIAYYKNERYEVPAEKVEEVIDTTGCGDNYLGAFAASYFKGLTVPMAMKQGALAAAQILAHVGGVC